MSDLVDFDDFDGEHELIIMEQFGEDGEFSFGEEDDDDDDGSSFIESESEG